MADIEPGTPVLIGHAAVEQRDDDHRASLEAVDLMIAATSRLLSPAVADRVLPHIDWIGATDGMTRYKDPARLVGEAIGAPDAHTVLAKVGVMQQTLISHACSVVQSGERDLALVVGGEARFRYVRAKQSGERASFVHQDDGVAPDETWTPATELVLQCELDAGLIDAAPYYALLESEWRAQRGQTLDAHRRGLGALYSRLSEIAADNPHAVRREIRTPEEIITPSATNPYIVYPYTKLMVTTWTVDQAAALLFCTAATAERLGVPRDRWLFPLAAVESNHMVPITARRALTQPTAMRAMARACERACGIAPSDVELVELYNPFPIALKLAAEGLGIPDGRDLTSTGGMSFAGGPWNNYVFQAMCRAAEALQAGRATTALVSCVSGLYTKQGFTVLGSDPPERPFSVVDVTSEVADVEVALTVDERPTSTGTIVAATVLFARDRADRVVAIMDLANGHRTLATSRDPGVVSASMQHEPVGRSVRVAAGEFSMLDGRAHG